MKTRILCIGDKMPDWVQTGFETYYQRVQPMMPTQLVELPAPKRHKSDKAALIEQHKQSEAWALLQAHQQGHQPKLWALDVKGRSLSTEQLAERLQTIMQSGHDLSLVIGGADGLGASVLDAADFKWSLSALTLPHPMVRVVLIEQLYRAMSILHHHPYHRAN